MINLNPNYDEIAKDSLNMFDEIESAAKKETFIGSLL